MDLQQIVITRWSGGWADYPAGASFGPRSLSSYEWVWIVEGQVVWEYAGKEYPMPPGSVLLARPGMRDGFRWDPKRRTRHGYIHCQIEDHHAQLPSPDTWPLVVRPEAENIVLPLLRHAAQLLPGTRTGEAALLTHSLQLAIGTWVRGELTLAAQLGGIDDHPVLATMLAALRTHWDRGSMQALSLGELAAAAQVSAGHLIRVCNQELGHSPQQVQRLLRLERAATLLTRSNLQVQAIAEQCGYQCPFHFSRQFKQVYALSPRQFRTKAQQGAGRQASPLTRLFDHLMQPK